ncbi:MAG: Fur family transcriptional regulator [Planctomycetota bacterium]|jgi:Fur family peroxide stress response transcriptional regulator
MKKTHIETAEFERRCKEAGLRLTNQRLALYRLLSNREDHPDAETLHRELMEEFPRTSRDTVYRALAEFERMGLVVRLPLSGGGRRFDPRPRGHHHQVCVRCGEIRDLDEETFDGLAPPGRCREGDRVVGVGVMVLVECYRCTAARCRGGGR